LLLRETSVKLASVAFVLDTKTNKVIETDGWCAKSITSIEGFRANFKETPPVSYEHLLYSRCYWAFNIGAVYGIEVSKGRYKILPNTEAIKVLYGKQV